MNTDDEPDLKSISNCIKKEKITITPEICKLFWGYRADSGHLHHLLFDLVGEDFVVSHRQDESIRKVLEEWRTPEEEKEHDIAIRKEEREKVLPTDSELKALKYTVCAAIANRIEGFELADNYYHKLKSLWGEA